MKRNYMAPAFQVLPPTNANASVFASDGLHLVRQGLQFTSTKTWKLGKGEFSSLGFYGRDYFIERLHFRRFGAKVVRIKAMRPSVLLIYVGNGMMELILKGGVSHSFNESTYRAIFLPKGIHTMKAMECIVTMIAPSSEHLNDYPYLNDLWVEVLRSGATAISLSPCTITDGVNRILYRLFHCNKKGCKLQLAVQSYILDLLITYGKQLKAKGAGNIQEKLLCVQNVTEYILLNLNGDCLINMSLLAKRFFTSRKILNKDFKEVYHESVYHFVKRQRMEYSKKMLLSTFSVQKTALALGYEDVFTFSKAFKRWWGYAPSQVWK